MVHFRVPLILVVCVVLYTTGAAAQGSDAPGENGTLHGYIVDTTPAQLPIVGVRVQIDNRKGHIFETTSAATSEFIYRDLPAGDYLINIHKPGYQRRVGKPVSGTNGGVHYLPLTMNKQENIFTKFQNLFRSKEPQGGTLQLQITTQFPQPDPIENTEVKISQFLDSEGGSLNKIEITGTSDANGQYRRDNLPSGVYIVTVSNNGYHTWFSMTVRENRITTASVELPISNGTADTDILPSQETDTKWVIRGKIFDTNFQQTPVSGVGVTISGENLEQPIDVLSNADGEYEFVLLPGHYAILLNKDGYEYTISFSEVTAESRQSNITVLKEGMFVIYEAVAKGNVLALKHGISKEQRNFSERYGITIRQALFFLIIGGISGFFAVRSLNKRKQKYSKE